MGAAAAAVAVAVGVTATAAIAAGKRFFLVPVVSTQTCSGESVVVLAGLLMGSWASLLAVEIRMVMQWLILFAGALPRAAGPLLIPRVPLGTAAAPPMTVARTGRCLGAYMLDAMAMCKSCCVCQSARYDTSMSSEVCHSAEVVVLHSGAGAAAAGEVSVAIFVSLTR